MKRCPNPACASLQFPDEANFCPNCAQRLIADAGPAQAAPAPADDGLLGGRFKLGDRFGGNRTGELHNATDNSDGSACVVKLVHGHVFPTPLLRQRSERELKQLERVQAATVARVLGHGKQGDRLWVATERVEGQTLKAVVGQGALTIDRAKGILLKIGDGLAEAAKVGVIHRDVSPKNVLVGSGDSIKLINFGIPTPLNETVQGEPEFLSPEQVEGKPVDQRSNIYSLGAIFDFMLTGRPPYVGDAATVMQAHLAGQLTPPSQRGTVPPNVEAIIVKALDRMSSKRFMTLRQLLTEVERSDATSAADSASQTTPFAAGGKGGPSKAAAAKTMMGMLAPGQGPIGEDGKPTDVVAIGPGAAQPPTQPAAAVSTFAPPSAATPAASPPTPAPMPVAQPTPPPQRSITPPPQRAVTPPPQPAQPEPQALSTPAPAAQPPAPSVPAPSVPAPQVSAEAVAQSGAGGKRGKAAAKAAEKESRKKKGAFRETLWFKKGELDAVAAEAAAAAKAQGNQDQLAQDKVDSLPMEDRYEDDGSVSVKDQQSFSLRTGHTQMMSAVGDSPASSGGMANDDLIDEMKSGRTTVILMIVGGLALVIGVVLFFVLK